MRGCARVVCDFRQGQGNFSRRAARGTHLAWLSFQRVELRSRDAFPQLGQLSGRINKE